MNFISLAKNRYSCRKYLSKPIEEAKLLQVLEAGRIAPSAANFQPWEMVVVKQKENLEKVYASYNREWIKQAPVCIIICCNHKISWKRSDGKDHADIDAAIITDHITLAATEIGLATCWICNFDKVKLIEVLNLPGNIEPVVILPIGYPDDVVNAERHTMQRKALETIVHWEKY